MSSLLIFSRLTGSSRQQDSGLFIDSIHYDGRPDGSVATESLISRGSRGSSTPVLTA